MTYPLSQALGPHVALPPLPREAVAGKANDEMSAGVQGVGAAQGTLVAVGDGLARKELHQDVKLAESFSDVDDDDDDDDNDIFFEAREGGSEIDDSQDGLATRRGEAPVASDAAFRFLQGRAGTNVSEFREMETDPSGGLGARGMPAVDELDDNIDEAVAAAQARNARAAAADGVHHAPVQGQAPAVVVHAGLAQERGVAEAQVQRQQGGWLQSMASLGGQALQTMKGSVISGAGYLMGKALERIPVAPPRLQKTAQQQNLDRSAELAARINHELRVLNTHVKGKTGKDIIDIEGQLSPVALTRQDRLFNARHTVTGALSAGTSTTGNLAGAAAVSLVATGVASMLGLPLLGIAGYLTGGFMAMNSVRSLSKNATDAAVRSMIDATEEQLRPLEEELRSIEKEEQARYDVENRIVLAAEPRSQQINALKTQLSHVEKALQPGAPASVEVRQAPARPLPQRVSMGNGVQRKDLLKAGVSMRERFSRFFNGIADFFRTRRMIAANDEHAYVNVASNKATFAALSSMRAPDSRIDALQLVARSQHKKDEPALRERLLQGENLVRTLQAAKGPSFGKVAFDAKDGFDARPVAATLSTSRMLAWYLDALARLPEPDRENHPDMPHVVRNADESLTIQDPAGKLSSFLMGVPTAYVGPTPGRSEITIDDHSPGMPGAMSGMKFSVDLKDGVQVLNLSFVPRSSGQIFRPLDQHGALVQLRGAMRDVGASADRGRQEIAGLSRQQLLDLRGKLKNELEPLEKLDQVDLAQLSALKNWSDPERVAERKRITG
ncbi:MAG: hypothetical protein ABWY08_10255 [Comamonas sp.]